MKRIICSALAALMVTSLMVGCSGKPSEEEVRSAIENGTLTVDDAVKKGYVTDEWVAEYTEERSVTASNKFSVNLLDAFTTQDINGEEFTFTPSDKPVLFVFADPADSNSLTEIQIIEEVYDEIKSAGGDVVLALMGETVPNELTDCSLPTIFYTDDIRTLLGNNTEMIDGNAFSASWNMKGSFITAWYRTLDKSGLAQTAKDLLDSFGESAPETGKGQEDLTFSGTVE